MWLMHAGLDVFTVLAPKLVLEGHLLAVRLPKAEYMNKIVDLPLRGSATAYSSKLQGDTSIVTE